MDVMIHAKLHKPDRMSNQEFFGVWKQEAEAALGAVQAGVIKNHCCPKRDRLSSMTR